MHQHLVCILDKTACTQKAYGDRSHGCTESRKQSDPVRSVSEAVYRQIDTVRYKKCIDYYRTCKIYAYISFINMKLFHSTQLPLANLKLYFAKGLSASKILYHTDYCLHRFLYGMTIFRYGDIGIFFIQFCSLQIHVIHALIIQKYNASFLDILKARKYLLF